MFTKLYVVLVRFLLGKTPFISCRLTTLLFDSHCIKNESPLFLKTKDLNKSNECHFPSLVILPTLDVRTV